MVLGAFAVVGVGGWLLVDRVGWEATLEVFGFEISTVVNAPDSQCSSPSTTQWKPVTYPGSTHCAIKPADVEMWRERWDALGV